jgi:signal transduction histidine kinase
MIGVQLLLGLAVARPHHTPVTWVQVTLLVAGPVALRILFGRPVLAAAAVAAVDITYVLLGYSPIGVIPSSIAAVVGPIARSRREAYWQWQQEERRRREVERERRLEQERRQAADERVRIARELHDILAHSLSLINVRASVALEVMDQAPHEVAPALQAIKQASRDGLAEVRAVLASMHPNTDDADPAPRRPSPDLSRLDDLVRQAEAAGLSVSVTRRGQVRALPASVELAAYRIIQEGLTNVMRHSSARSATLVLEYAATDLTVELTDPGPAQRRAGSDQEGSTRGFGAGLVGLRERAIALGGSARAEPDGAGGFRVVAVLPIAAAQRG